MPLIRTTTSVPANGKAFPLVGSQFEYLPYNARVSFAVVGPDTTPGAITATIYSGSDIVQQDGPITEKPTTDQKISLQDDFLVSDVAAGGERLSVVLNNSSAAAITVLTAVQIYPI
jgi:hypothetical protein